MILSRLNDTPEPEFQPVVGRRAWYFNQNTAWIWLRTTEDSEWGALDLMLDCDDPPLNHALHFELYESWTPLLDLLFDSPRTEEDTDKCLFEEGLAPGQAFLIEVRFIYTPEYSEGIYEGCSVEARWKMLDKEPWTNQQVLEAWESLWLHRQDDWIPPCQ